MARNIGRIVFRYALVLLPIVVLIAGFGMMAGLREWETLLWAVAGCLLIGAGMFTFFEVRRLTAAGSNPQGSEEQDVDQYAERILIVQPPTGEPYPHHENHAESAGLDQGQLTSRIPDSTPLVGDLVGKKGSKHRRSD